MNQSKKFKNLNSVKRGQEGEKIVYNKYGGKQQESYLNGNIVISKTDGSVRSDLIREVNCHLEAIEIKNYNLDSPTSRRNLIKVLKEQVAERIRHLPKGSTQRICLVTKGRNYNKKFINSFIKQIQNELSDIYYNIPISSIIDVANYLENNKGDFLRKFHEDELKNKNIPIKEQRWL